MWLLIFDLVLFLGTVWYLRWRKNTNELTSIEFGLFVGAVWSFITLSPFLIFASNNFRALTIGAVVSIIE
ncbi:MAG TPA: hypothetical protein VJ965_07015, partial [Anaerolineales bacterium]|nr:hypothetical protein [Anaerolineales bacterium]